ncbi:MAG: DUF4231 domain-containing protein [Pseudomonadota bacterium]
MEAPETKLDFVKNKLNDLIPEYREKRNRMRLSASLCRVALIFFAGSTPVLLGLNEYEIFRGDDNLLSVVALIFSAAAAATASWEIYASYSWRWVHYRSVLVKLYAIRDKLEYDTIPNDDNPSGPANPSISSEASDTAFDQIMALLGEADEEWSANRAGAITSKIET